MAAGGGFEDTGEKPYISINGYAPQMKDPRARQNLMRIEASRHLMNEIDSEKEFCDPNEVKVVVDHDFYALYFSREPIPSKKKFNKDFKKYKQVCVIPFKRDALHIFNSLEETELEKIESIDMLRLLENKYKVKMILSNTQVYSVDTDEDLKKVEKKMKSDKFVSLYG